MGELMGWLFVCACVFLFAYLYKDFGRKTDAIVITQKSADEAKGEEEFRKIFDISSKERAAQDCVTVRLNLLRGEVLAAQQAIRALPEETSPVEVEAAETRVGQARAAWQKAHDVAYAKRFIV